MKKENQNKSIQPANRLNNVSEYYFSRKNKEVAELNAQGKDIISLGIGSPDRPPMPEAIDVLCEEGKKDNVHGYQPYVGIPELRTGFAEWYKKWFKVDLDPKTEIQPLIGSKEGILHITLAFVNPGEQVLVPDPGYPTYTSLSNILGAEVVHYDLNEEGGWLPNFEELEKLDLSKVKLMWTNYPHMPTGTKANYELFEKLYEFGKKHNIIIINDNPYSFVLNDEQLSILSVPGAKSHCIAMNSMSKSHNMAGWRVGMIASNADFISSILKVKSNVDSGTFRPIQLAAVRALKAEQDWYDSINEVYAKRRKVAGQIMDALNCSYSKDQVGMFVWGRIPDKYEDVEDLTEKLLHEARTFITPGFIFGKNGARYIRITLCNTEENLKEALRRIKSINLE